MISLISLFSSASAAAKVGEPFYVYDQQSVQWPDNFCNMSEFQQTPIEVQMDQMVGELEGSASIYTSSSFKYKKGMHVHMDDKIHLDMEYDLKDPMAHFIKVTKDATDTEDETTTMFYLYNVHFHVGRAEHVVSDAGTPQVTDANVHAVHLSDDGQIAVVEIPYKFSESAETDIGFMFPEKCSDGNFIASETFCGMRDENGTVAKEGKESMIMETEEPWTENTSDKTLLSLLGLKEGAAISDFVSYKGSLTTPLCDGDVTWFVYTKGPIEIKPWANWESIRDLFPNEDTSGVSGNYRVLQEKKEDAKFGHYRAASPEGSRQSMIGAGFVAAALAVLF